MIIDPWGKILAEANGHEHWSTQKDPVLIFADVDLEYLSTVRRNIPLRPRRDIVNIVDIKRCQDDISES